MNRSQSARAIVCAPQDGRASDECGRTSDLSVRPASRAVRALLPSGYCFAGFALVCAALLALSARGGQTDDASPSSAPQAAPGVAADRPLAFPDDTDTLQALVDDASGAVVLTQQVYRITRPIDIQLDQVGPVAIRGRGAVRIIMAGPGPALRIRGTHFKSADPQGVEPKVWLRERMPRIEDLAIEGAHPEADGIEAAGTMQLTVSRVHIRGVRHGIRLVQNNRNIIISDAHIYENRGAGIYYDEVNLHQSNITGCHISYNSGGGIVCRAGNVRNIHVTGCDLESNMAPNEPPTANILIDCRDSEYGTGEVAITGCTIQHNNPSPGSANIRILGRSNPKEGQPVREGNITITGNVLSDVKTNIHLNGCRGVVISGNTFWQGYEHNLLVEDCVAVVVGPNNFDRNPRYDYGNTQEANNAIVLRDCRDSTLNGLLVTNVWREPAGVLLENCRCMNITNCTILDCDGAGLVLKNVHDSRVSGCLIRDNRAERPFVPLKVIGGSGNMVAHNLMDGPAEIEAGTARVLGNVYPGAE